MQCIPVRKPVAQQSQMGCTGQGCDSATATQCRLCSQQPAWQTAAHLHRQMQHCSACVDSILTELHCNALQQNTW